MIFDLVFRKYDLDNHDRLHARKSLRAAFIHAIYNKGRVNQVYRQYPAKLKEFLSQYDSIFTTNYDSNLESGLGHSIYHLHGSFDQLADVYNIESLRNHMHDAPIQNTTFDKDYYYIYSTALTDYTGFSKDFRMNQNIDANNALENLYNAYQTNPEAHNTIENLQFDNNEIARKFYESVQLKLSNPNLRFTENYPVKELNSLAGYVTFLGLSPFNDTHIFDRINTNDNVNEVHYYFYLPDESTVAKDLLKDKVVHPHDVRALWEEMNNGKQAWYCKDM